MLVSAAYQSGDQYTIVNYPDPVPEDPVQISFRMSSGIAIIILPGQDFHQMTSGDQEQEKKDYAEIAARTPSSDMNNQYPL